MPLTVYEGSSIHKRATTAPESWYRRWQESSGNAFVRQNAYQLFETILKVTTEGIFGVDAEGYCTFINDSAASMLGYTPARLLGTAILERIQPSLEEARFVRSDGSSFPVNVMPYPWVEDGEANGTVYVFEDPTDRLRLEAELREARKRHRELFDYVSSGIYQTSPEGELLAVNPALIELLGFRSEQELRALDVATLYVDPEQRKIMTSQLERDGFLRNVVLRLRRREGCEIQVTENARVVRGEDGRVLYYEGTLNRS